MPWSAKSGACNNTIGGAGTAGNRIAFAQNDLRRCAHPKRQHQQRDPRERYFLQRRLGH